jgi:hypothetical protein
MQRGSFGISFSGSSRNMTACGHVIHKKYCPAEGEAFLKDGSITGLPTHPALP